MTKLPALILAATVAAQSNDTLAPGPPALTRADQAKIVSMIEWTLDAQLTPAERSTFEQNQIASWQTTAPAARQNLVALAKTYDLISSLPAEQKTQVHQGLQQKFLEMIRSTPDSAGSKLLLAAYDRAHRSPAAAAMPVRGGMLADLVGEWSSMHTSSVNFVDRSTGSYAAPSGNGMQYKFFPDGRFQSAALIQSSLYNCTMTVNAWEEGTIEIKGNVIVFHSNGGTLDSKDNCSASSNYRKQLPANNTTYTFRVERDQWGTKFCVSGGTVKDDCAYKK
ncbi:MAG: hypothetical protein U0Q16_00040 [Bryobacteraceae bacterium]